MKEIRTARVIGAPRNRVFAAFMDKAAWKEFSAMEDLSPDSAIESGGRFRFRIKIPGLPRLSIEVKVLTVEPDREVRWVGVLPLFRGEHYFRFEEAEGGGTRLIHGERFSGLLGDGFVIGMGDRVARIYDDFNEGLANRLERVK